MNEVTRPNQQGQNVATTRQAQEQRTLLPAVDIYEEDEALHVIADMPGVTRDALHIEVDDNVLTLEGEISFDMPEDITASYAEVQGQRFSRRFTLSQEVDSEAIRAELRDGVVYLLLPKRDTHRRRRIEIQAA
ncbi:Hsp20/alpha crystallin family protein [Chromohalobacter canadensis]|uniref:Hsp20/alpha crystallin family protein n=1 Tax=Chromohalobacter canadensis TaxID=141389 RepID=A0ABZ0YF81_9GAMM|nr:Hsp20/alpha crystallin family protein [Chromohalobacter canadensis]MCK0769609.1 Hsp20/alpha crystallin family protein [Chromohalobacter canadensis]WQH10389.1 Hsp20/alpha crystallin family protein [Chromohalobacter canadensis]